MDYSENKMEEIDLISYIKVISKRKYLIFALFLLGLIMGWGVHFLMQKTYKAEVILEIGSFYEQSEETITYRLLEESLQTAAKIKGGLYGDYPGIKATVFEDTELIKIEVNGKTSEEAEEVLKSIKEEVLTEHNRRLEFYKGIVEKKKAEYNELISNFERDISNLRKDVSVLISQNQQIATLHAKIYDLQVRIYDLRLKVKDVQKEIETFQPTKMIGEPIISEGKPNRLLNLSAGGILGIFIGVVLAFFKEWWDKNKYKVKQ